MHSLQLEKLLLLALLAIPVKADSLVVFNIIGTMPASYSDQLGFVAQNGTLAVTGVNTPLHSAVTETLRGGDGLFISLGPIIASDTNHWFFAPADNGGAVAIEDGIFFYEPFSDPRNIPAFGQVIDASVGEAEVTTSDGTNFTLTATLNGEPTADAMRLTDFYGISGNPSSIILTLNWTNPSGFPSNDFSGATGQIVETFTPEPGSLLLLLTGLAGAAAFARKHTP
jgi:hypothetical protein